MTSHDWLTGFLSVPTAALPGSVWKDGEGIFAVDKF